MADGALLDAPVEVEQAISAAHARVGPARFPQLHSTSSSSIIRYQTDDEDVISEPEYTLTKPSSCPNDRDHLTRTGDLPDMYREYRLDVDAIIDAAARVAVAAVV